MVTWGFLTIGIFLGAHWAYSVLGWGGYWGWDPVENASLMPWLTGTAFLHSVMMQEKRGMLKMWNMWLVFATFWLAILGNVPDAQRHHQFGSRFCAVVDWRLVRLVPVAQPRGLRCFLRAEQIAPCGVSTSWSRWFRANRVSCSTICCCWWLASRFCGERCSR